MSKHLSQTDLNTLLTQVASTGSAITISGAVSATGLINLTATAHGLVTPASAYTPLYVIVSGVGGTTEANGLWAVTIPDVNHITLVGSAFVHAYTSGGSAVVMSLTGGQTNALTPVQLQDLLFSTEHTAQQPATAIGTILAIAT